MTNRPSLLLGLSLPMEMFNYLNSSRQYGMGPNPLPVHEILAACRLFDIPRHNWPEYLFFMKELDSEWMEHSSKKRKSQ